MTDQRTKTAAIYTRISSDAEQEGLGVARQEEDCRARADREDIQVVQVYCDNDVSASTNSHKPRPAFEQMMKDAAAGRFGVILAYSNSRLTRRPLELETLIEHHAKHGTRFLTVVSGDDDLSTADGRMVARLKASIDAGEAERTAERLRRKHRQLAESGHHNGPRPFGWAFTPDRRLVVDPAEAAVVREAANRVLAGEGLWRIVGDFNRRGIRTSTGTTWATQTLRRLLLRWRNCGYRSHRPLVADLVTGKMKPSEKPELYPGQWEPLYEREFHERVVAKLTDPARRSNNRGTAVKYLLTGIAHCGACGGPVVGTNEFSYEIKGTLRKDGTRGPSRTRRYPHMYKCPHAGCHAVTRNMAEVDDYVTEIVLGLLDRDGVRLLGGDPTEAESARRRIDALEAKLALAADQFADDTITASQLQRITGRVRPELDAEKARLRNALPAEGLQDFATSGTNAWANTDDIEIRRHVINSLGVVPIINPVGPGNTRVPIADSVQVLPREQAQRLLVQLREQALVG